MNGVLTRRVGESLKIGEDVTVTVLGIKGNQVRVGAAEALRLARVDILALLDALGGDTGPGGRGIN